MARGINFNYQAGKVEVSCKARPRAIRGLSLWGSPWRGLLVLPGLVLAGFGYVLPGALVVGLALPLSLVATARIKWGEIAGSKRAAAFVRKGLLQEAYEMYLDDDDAPWLWLAGVAMEKGEWTLGLQCLEHWQGPEDEGKMYQALCQLEKGYPAKALQILPGRQTRDVWLIRAQCYLRQQEWKKLLGLGRRGLHAKQDKNEHVWLRAQAYLKSGEERSARHLLRQLVEKNGNYGDASDTLKELMGKEGKK